MFLGHKFWEGCPISHRWVISGSCWKIVFRTKVINYLLKPEITTKTGSYPKNSQWTSLLTRNGQLFNESIKSHTPKCPLPVLSTKNDKTGIVQFYFPVCRFYLSFGLKMLQKFLSLKSTCHF